MIAMLFILLLTAGGASAVARAAGRRAGLVLSIVPVVSFLALACMLPLAPGDSWVTAHRWFPALGVELAFRVDALALLFCLLITGVGSLVAIYCDGYFSGARRGLFLTYLFAFMVAMLGVVTADNTIALFVFWELTSVVSYLLVGFEHRDGRARAAALRALLVTGAGGLALLLGFLLWGIAAVDLGLAPERAASLTALASVDVRGHPLYVPAVVAILVGAFSKSAQFPLHFWLPGAMTAPTPASAYLHSATMVNAGVYLVARLTPALADTALWTGAVVGVGAVTMAFAAVVGLRQRDLKRLLAYSTVAVLGTLMMLLGLGSADTVEAALVLLCAHALYKAALFMIAGNVARGAGTRDIARLGGLRARMPVTALAGVLAAASMAGLPPLFGFVGKELLYASKLALPSLWSALLVLALVANAALVAIALLAVARPFFGPASPSAERAREVPVSMLVGPVVLAVGGLSLGLAPGLFADAIGAAAATATLGRPAEMELALWHGFGAEAVSVMALSAVTVIAGALLFRRADRAFARVSFAEPSDSPPTVAERIYDGAVEGLFAAARWTTRAIQTGDLNRYVAIVLAVAVVATAAPIAATLVGPLPIDRVSLDAGELGVAIAIVIGAVGAACIRSHLGAIASLGVTGLGLAVVFALYGAPDLALTTIAVEALLVLVLVLVFRHLPTPRGRVRSRLRRVRDLALAVSVGAVAAGLTLATAAVHLPADAARFYTDNSVAQGKGGNVVNVILVDFRSLDTLGEVLVVAVAGIGVLALLGLAGRGRGDAA